MLTLSGKNLGERHHEFNLRVTEAADITNYYERTSEDGHFDISDIDKLFQIDVASKYRHFDYLLDMLKSGDSLYITRVLKCKWIYDDEYSNVMNPNYLHQNLFPHMSQRMMTKLLTTISIHVRNEERVLCFYSYCVKSKMNKLALKFILFIPQPSKLDLITKGTIDGFNDIKYLKHFIGSSFALAAAYVEMHQKPYYKPYIMHELRFLYFDFQLDYLDLLERFGRVDDGHDMPRFGIRISRHILKRHKKRVLLNPELYVNKLNKNMLVKYMTSQDVKKFGILLLPETSSDFWAIDFYNTYKFMLDLLPSTRIFAYLKKIFSYKYRKEYFSLDIRFYNQKYYEMLTAKQQESWALQHIARGEELFGSGNDYIWYKFIGFDKALAEIKKYVMITPDNKKRSEIVNTLIISAKSQEDLIKLFNYYKDRHINENIEHKICFIDLIISNHDIYSFTDKCWSPFHKLLYSLEEYQNFKQYVMRSMMYHILNNKEFSESLINFINEMYACWLYYDLIRTLSEERRSLVIKYWLAFHENKFRLLLQKPCDEKVQEDIYDVIGLVWDVIWVFDRDKKECPETVLTYMLNHMDIYQYHGAIKEKFKETTEEDFVRLLKTDIVLAVEGISKVMCNAYRWSFRLNRLFRKLKVYFAKDVSQEYLNYFVDSLDWLNGYGRQYRNIKMAVAGVFQLGNRESKLALMEKYTPVNSKMDHKNIDKFLLQIQKAICRLCYQSRPPIESSIVLKYVTGDYVRFCLPIFNHYLANFPSNRVIQFIYKIIDLPVSILKHGLRMAFKCFPSQDIVQITQNIWKKTKNVSLRMVLFTTLYSKVISSHNDSQSVLYDVLEMCTLELDQQDHEDVFDLLVSDDMPEELRGSYIKKSWLVVSEFSNKNINIVRKINLIRHMKENIDLLDRKFLRDQIIEEHVRTMLQDNNLITPHSSQLIEDLNKSKWDLTAAYIVNDNEIPESFDENHNLVKDIILKCLQMWKHQYKGIYIVRQFCIDFLKSIYSLSCDNVYRYTSVIPIYQSILDVFQNLFPKEQTFLLKWQLELSIISRYIIDEHFSRHNSCLPCKDPCVVEVAETFASKIRELVKKLLDKSQFYYSFYKEMTNEIKNVCETMDQGMNTSGFKILVSGYLSQFETNELLTFAVMLIPKEPPADWEKRHDNALNMIKQHSLSNEEIRSHLVYKFTSDSRLSNIL